MELAVFEYPLNEKVRSYLRLEQLFEQLAQANHAEHNWQFIGFFEGLFTLLDLIERLDMRNDLLKDLESHEKNLVQWSQHPNIDNDALQSALQNVINLRDNVKRAKKIGSVLKDDRFLSAIRQRFAIPGGTCSFDLPNLHYWLSQPEKAKKRDISSWMNELKLLNQVIDVLLSFLRERGQFKSVHAKKGFYQGIAEDKIELVRIRCEADEGFYPVLSGNKYRYAIRFMKFEPDSNGSTSVDKDIAFEIANC